MLAGFSLLVLLFLISIPVVNDVISLGIEKDLKDTPLPIATELCDSLSVAGKIVGNGNGMQFFGAILIKSALSSDELEKHYSQFRKDEWSYIVEAQIGAEITADDIGSLSFSHLENMANIEGYYIVYSWGSSSYPFSDFDIRGH